MICLLYTVRPSPVPLTWSVIITKTFYECVYLSTCVYSPRREKTLSEEEPSSPTSLPEGISTSGVARIFARRWKQKFTVLHVGVKGQS